MNFFSKLARRIMPVSVKNTSTSDFFVHLEALLTASSFFYYQEGCYECYRPNTAPKYTLEASPQKRIARVAAIFNKLEKQYGLKQLEKSYTLFEDDRSKNTFLHIALNQLYSSQQDPPLVRLPIFYSKHYIKLDEIAKCQVGEQSIILWNGILHFNKYDLSPLGIDLVFFGGPDGILIEFIYDQYCLDEEFSVKENDVVIDGGACYGETALHFATQTRGNIYSFEFMPENVALFHKNLELNPKYNKNITLTQKPLGKTSGEKLYAIFNGPGTSVSSHFSKNATELTSISIDDFVRQQGLARVDFIKLDIEGSEENVLLGASETIKRFKPKLAICGYHKKNDLVVLPQLILNICSDYTLHIDHCTSNNTETVIYAKPKK